MNCERNVEVNVLIYRQKEGEKSYNMERNDL